MTETIKTRALVVYAMPWSDTSKIIHLFTHEHGYLKVIAKGARRPKSPFRGVMEVLNEVEAVLSVKESRGLQILTQADLLDTFHNIRDDLNRTAIAFSILELIRLLLNYREPMTSMYEYTIRTLQTMNRPDAKEPLLYLLYFLLVLSRYLGFAWDFSHCARCQKTPQSFPLQVDLANGAIICRNCAPPGTEASRRLDRRQWELLSRLEEAIPQDAKALNAVLPSSANGRILELLLDHLRYHTDQSLQLKSLKMYLP